MRLYYWIHHTGRYDRNTGVQRVTRNLALALFDLGHELIPVRWCSEREAVVRAEARWLEGLARFEGPALPELPEEGVPIHLASIDAGRLDGGWMVLPEVPHAEGEEALSLPVVFDYARFYGLRTAAIFYDLIPLRQPGYERMVEAHERYVRSLVAADLVLPISDHAAADLRAWWAQQGYDEGRLPQVVAASLAAEIVGVPRAVEVAEPGSPIRFTTLGTVEPRKNQLEVMRAFERLVARRPDLDLRLDLVGGIHEAVAEAVTELSAQDTRIALHGYIPDSDARALVAAAHATVFMSLYEGFGLPIAESLWQGIPCLCSDHGSMAEVASGGGCIMVPATDGTAIEKALERLADDAGLRRRLREEAVARPLRSWHEYADDVLRALTEAPVLREVVMIEGSRGLAPDEISPRIAIVRRLHWRPESRALLPGAREVPEPPRPGAGELHGLPAVISAASAAGHAELVEIIEAARGLGMRVILEAEQGTPVDVAASADVALFRTERELNAALAEAMRVLPRTVGVRARFQLAEGAAVAEAIRSVAPRLSVAGSPQRPRRVFYWTGLTAEQPFNSGIQRVTRMLGAALQRRGVEVIPVGWDDTAGRMTVISEAGRENLGRWNGPQFPVSPELPTDLSGEWLLLPEITVPVRAAEIQRRRPCGVARDALRRDLLRPDSGQDARDLPTGRGREHARLLADLRLGRSRAADLVDGDLRIS